MALTTEIFAQPSSSAVRVRLQRGESVTTEVGAMIAMSSQIGVETRASKRGGGGLMQGLKRMFAGENFFLNHFTARADGQELLLGPALPGDIVKHSVTHGSLIVQGSSWLASEGVELDATWQGLGKALLGGEGFFWMRCTGRGDILLNSFGGIYAVDVQDGYVVDTGHIVAFEDTLQFSLGKAGQSLIGSFLSGEGLVAKFHGRGRLYCQTHHPTSFGRALGPLLRPRRE